MSQRLEKRIGGADAGVVSSLRVAGGPKRVFGAVGKTLADRGWTRQPFGEGFEQ